MKPTDQIIQTLKDGKIILTRQGSGGVMVLTNFVEFPDGFIAMHGDWFNPENNGGNRITIKGKDLRVDYDGPEMVDWRIKDILFMHYRRREYEPTMFETFDKVAKIKRRLKYDFEAAQKRVAELNFYG